MQAPAAAQHVLVRCSCLPAVPPNAECRLSQAVPVACGLTLPSRGRHPASRVPPLMSNVRPHTTMRRLILLVVLAIVAWQGYGQLKERKARKAAIEALETELPSVNTRSSPSGATPATPTAQFSCDGRTYCSQMTSCAEATFFLKNCPGVKMDGNNDGVPCEQQWCKR